MHVTPQVAPLHVAVPVAGAGQAVHEAPQVASALFETHAPPQRWKPALQVAPQAVPLHEGVPLATAGQAVHAAPQVATALFDTHAPPQR